MSYKSILDYNKITGYSINILIYDNSPYFQEYEEDEVNEIIYIRDSSNSGVAKAYNKGLQICIERKIPWILLLDQDTILDESFFKKTEQSLLENEGDSNIVCFIPKIFSRSGKMLSPMKLKKGGLVGSIKNMNFGIQCNNATGLNSGTLLRVSYLRKIEGFNEQFGLDMLDHWLFREINKSGYVVFLTQAEIQHNLSVMNFEKEMSPDRYRNLLLSERIFLEGNSADVAVYKLRLLVRIFKYLFFKEKQFLVLTLKAVFQ
ncbi:glycosyltransferase [Saccharicrinis sp. FJH2]|uniref:glycosyltransferase n=1 Tax=Saccharicrinis sp. FJH65 TaxID=3344659 RepID=UPI0035F43189